MLRVRLVGELGLEVDGDPVDTPGPAKARAVLAWLALHPGSHSRSEVAGTFWPDVLEESARASLRTALSSVRRALGEAGAPHLKATREAVELGGDLWVDARDFEALAAQGRLEEALAVGDGELLGGLDDEWARDARDGHRERRAELLGELAARAERAGDPAGAARHARRRVALDPLSEDATRDLMRRLAAAGDSAGALVAYDELRERLRTTLAIAPSAPTRALADEVRAGKVAPTQAAGGRPPSSPLLDRAAQSPFVGREADTERATGATGLVVIEGEAGVGKTRLALELARAVRDDGGVALAGRCSEEPLRSYEAWAEALRPLVEAAPPDLVDAADRAVLARLYGGASATDAEGERWRLFEAVRAVLAAVAQRWPLVVVLDDLHWADRPTLLLLGHLVRAPEGAPARLIGTYRASELARDHPLGALLADARREQLAARVSLRGLEPGATAALVAASTGAQTPERVTDAVHAETAGNPFFVVEIARHLAETGVEFGEKGRWTGAFSLAEVGLPESVREVVGRRLDRLGDPAHAVLRDAAVLGERFSLDALGPAPPADDLMDALDAALAAGLVREEPGAPGHFAFAHALVRKTLYEELGAARRVRAHQAAADRLLALREGGRAVSAAELAHHLLEGAPAGDPVMAAAEAERAAAEATAALAWEEAALHAERGLRALEWLDAPPAELRARLLLAVGEAQMRAGDREPARVVLREAMEAYGALERPTELARAALAFGGVGIFIGRPDDEVAGALEAALAALPPDEHRTRARLLGRLAVERYYEPSGETRRRLSEAALAAARRAGDDATLAVALNARHVGLWDPDHAEERLRVADEMIVVAERAGDRETALQGRNWRVVDLFELGRIDDCWAQVDDHAEVADALRLPTYRWYEPLWRGVRAALEGRFEDAAALRVQARAQGLAAGDENAELFAAMLQYDEATIARDWSGLDWPFFEEALRSSPAAYAYRSGYAWILAEIGATDEAQAELDALAADDFAGFARDANWLSVMSELAQTCVILGDRERAAIVHELLTPYAERTGSSGRAVNQYGHIVEFLGRLGLLLGRPGARDQLATAQAFYERHGWAPYAQRCRSEPRQADRRAKDNG